MEEKQMDKPKGPLPPAPQHQTRSMPGLMMRMNRVMTAEQVLSPNNGKKSKFSKLTRRNN